MTDHILAGTYNYWLVALSVAIAALASYSALDLGGRITAARRRMRIVWLFGGGLSMGIGIWSMHYVGMLAFRLPLPIQYDWPTTLLSFVAGLLASLTALFVISRLHMRWGAWLGGSVFMGAAIVALHYIAMDSMRVQAVCHYSAPLVALSVFVAIIGSAMALWLTFYFRDERGGRQTRKLTSALAMGGAIASMHYTAMAAASFTRSAQPPDLSRAVPITDLAMAGVSGVPIMVLIVTILTCMIDRLHTHKALLTKLSGQLLESQEEERRRLARELHDSTGQKLAALAWNLAVVDESADRLDTRAGRALKESITLTDQSLREIRTLAYLLHPPELEELGLHDVAYEYVAGFVQRSGIPVELKVPPDLGRLHPEVETAIFRILQESLSNIHRHSGTERATVEITRNSIGVTIKVADKGRGVRTSTADREANTSVTMGVGIAGMRERVAQLGGSLEIRSDKNGTTLQAFFPFNH